MEIFYTENSMRTKAGKIDTIEDALVVQLETHE